jgi:hypothetical protein
VHGLAGQVRRGKVWQVRSVMFRSVSAWSVLVRHGAVMRGLSGSGLAGRVWYG